MTEILLEPLICRKYPRNIQNTLNLYFSNFRCFKSILVILHVQGYFGHNLGFSGFYRSFFFIKILGLFWSFFQVLGYFDHFQVSRYFGKYFQVSGVFQLFFRFQRYFGHFLDLRSILVIFFFGLGSILVIFQVQGVFW